MHRQPLSDGGQGGQILSHLQLRQVRRCGQLPAGSHLRPGPSGGTRQALRDPEGSRRSALDLSDYMKRRVYMYASGDCVARLRIDPFLVSDVIDMFGKNVTFSDEDDSGVTVTVYASEMSVEQFAKSYVPHVTVLGPELLRKKVKGMLEQTMGGYQ